MMKFAVNFGHPIAVRYPRGEAFDGLKEMRAPIVYGKSEALYEEEDIALFAVGSMVKTALLVRSMLKERGYACSVVNGRFIKPIDEDAVRAASREHKLIVTMEENVASGGYGEKISEFVEREEISVSIMHVALPDAYVEHGNVEALKAEVGISADIIVKRIITKYIGIR